MPPKNNDVKTDLGRTAGKNGIVSGTTTSGDQIDSEVGVSPRQVFETLNDILEENYGPKLDPASERELSTTFAVAVEALGSQEEAVYVQSPQDGHNEFYSIHLQRIKGRRIFLATLNRHYLACNPQESDTEEPRHELQTMYPRIRVTLQNTTDYVFDTEIIDLDMYTELEERLELKTPASAIQLKIDPNTSRGYLSTHDEDIYHWRTLSQSERDHIRLMTEVLIAATTKGNGTKLASYELGINGVINMEEMYSKLKSA